VSLIFRKNGIYRRRWLWWFPWGITAWYRPRVSRGADEWCNDSLVFVAPPLGGLVLFWRPGRLRALPCQECWAQLDAAQRADYAPCGWLNAGRLHPRSHHHFETGPCAQALAWLRKYPYLG
jgi:hypothetical protein